jgi:5'(3')-deoxyribonucleotidase
VSPKEISIKRRVFLDMDGVIVDFDGYKKSLGLTGDEVKKQPGAYLKMKPYPGAFDGIKNLVGAGYDVWLATKPPTGISFAYADKAEWVFQYLPELKRKIIITHDKGLLGNENDFLVDDRPHKANCENFRGTLIKFIDGMTWDEAIRLIRKESAAPKIKICTYCGNPDDHMIHRDPQFRDAKGTVVYHEITQ